jgi:alanyl-tRNA synthetase
MGVEKSLAASRREILAKIDKLKDGLDASEKENRALRKKMAGGTGTGDEGRTVKVKDVQILVRRAEGLAMAELRELADSLKQKLGSGVVFLGATDGDKVLLVASVSKDLTSRIQAGALIKEAAPVVGGGGGGRPDFAQAGGNRPGELDKLLEMVPAIAEKLLA